LETFKSGHILSWLHINVEPFTFYLFLSVSLWKAAKGSLDWFFTSACNASSVRNCAATIEYCIDDTETNEFGAVGGMQIGRGNYRKLAPATICP
jgi:hypothetical protein